MPVLGVGLGIASGVLGVFSGVQWEAGQRLVKDDIYPLGVSGQELIDKHQEAERKAVSSYALAGVAVGCGIGSLIALVVSASQGRSARGAGFVPPLLVPSKAGAIVHWEARW